MKLNINRSTKILPEGTYTGTIMQTTVSNGKTFIWFNIIVDKLKVIFNTSLAINSEIFTNFAENYLDENCSFDTDDLALEYIIFTVTDKEATNGSKYSKIVEIAPFTEDFESCIK